MKDVPDMHARVHRTLKPLARFRQISEVTQSLPHPRLADGDELLGVYENEPSELNHYIIVGAKGIYIDHGDAWRFIPYEVMTKTVLPEGDKHAIDRLTIKLMNGDSIVMAVSGGDNKFRDVFEIVRFLDRVIPKHL